MRRYLPWLMLAAFAWYAVLPPLLAGEPPDPLYPSRLGLAFNSMAQHLLAGRFDIDPDAIDSEAFLVGGRTVAYFGVFCALLRMPLVLLGGGGIDLTRISCWIAVCLAAWFQVRAVLVVRGTLPASLRRDWLCGALVVALLAGGQGVQFARPSVFQEVVDWAVALAMAFVLLAIRGIILGFTRRALCGMALLAGLALLTRVSFGIGLYAALGALLVLPRTPGRFSVLAILSGFAMLTGVVNQGRWGNPFVFADFTRYAMNLDVTTDRLGRLAAYGAFNPQRIWLGLSYYFVPIWGIVRGDGHLLFAAAQTRLVDVLELPPGSFLLSDPLLLGLCTVGIASVRRWPPVVLLAGLTAPPALMLCAISMAYRYRGEFYPLFVLGALLGVRHLCIHPDGLGQRGRAVLIAAVLLGLTTAHMQAALYAVSPWGPAEPYLEQEGWSGTFGPALQQVWARYGIAPE